MSLHPRMTICLHCGRGPDVSPDKSRGAQINNVARRTIERHKAQMLAEAKLETAQDALRLILLRPERAVEVADGALRALAADTDTPA
jgi:hypothetical protein